MIFDIFVNSSAGKPPVKNIFHPKVTKQQEQMAKIKEYEVHVEQMKIEQKRVEGEEKRKYLEQDAQIAKTKSEYQVMLSSERIVNKGLPNMLKSC